MQKDYSYVLSEPVGKNFDPEFKPELSPKELLGLGIFGGNYMKDCGAEFPGKPGRAVPIIFTPLI